VVVSGLAKGIDTAAHRAAIDAGGSTVGVIGTPMDQAYPPENAELQKLIGERYLLISQFPMGRSTQRFNFPRRNRTMALISHATVIVEAGETSGSLSQGWEAIRLNRPLFLMSSVVESGLKWPEEMLPYGAHVLRETEELMELLPASGRLAAAAF
jgi:DNA processing protein